MADIVLKDRNGNDVTYSGIETVTFDTPTDGVQATFTEGVKVEGIEIGLDMSNGDQNITAPEGTLVKSAIIKKPEAMISENIRNGVEIGGVVGDFIGDTEETTVELSMVEGDQIVEPSTIGKVLSKVTVTKPETLVPENIAEGVNIGGIIGSFKGGGVKIATGVFKITTAGMNTVTHDLGVVPDYIQVACNSNMGSGYRFSCGFSSAFFTKYMNDYASSVYPKKIYVYDSAMTGYADTYIDSTNAPAINTATETTFNIGSLTKGVNANRDYHWFAIGGLT